VADHVLSTWYSRNNNNSTTTTTTTFFTKRPTNVGLARGAANGAAAERRSGMHSAPATSGACFAALLHVSPIRVGARRGL
jgi:hypothetical protein